MNKYDLNLITKSITEQLNKDKQLTSYSLSKCVKGYFKLKNVFKAPNNDDLKSILDFCLDACIYHNSTFQNMNENFINVMLSYLDNDIDDNSQFDTFNFKEEKPTRKIMATLVACSIIGVHVILISKTGLGKTAAMTFSRTNKLRPKLLSPHIISFNGETQLDELYGYFTIEKGNFSHHQGQLSQAMSEGQVFFADKLNLADSKIIQSLNVAIEPSSGESIILLVIGSPIVVEKGFFFIGCKNNLTMNGRKPIPESIKKKILCIKYPDPFNMSIDIVFLVDGTNSMDFFRIAVCNCCQEIAKKCKEKLPMNEFRFGAVVYRDTIVTEKFKYRDVHDEVDYKALTDNIDDISDFFDNLIVYGGGGDGPEDWVSGYRCLLSDEMNWSDDSAKIVIHICDAPGHGNHFLSEPQFKEFCCIVPNFDHNNNEAEDRAIYEQIQEEQDREFTTLIKQAAHKGLMFFCLNNHQNAVYCLKKVKEIYKKNNGIKFVIKNQFYDEDINDEYKLNNLIGNIKDIVICALDLSTTVLHQEQEDFEKSCDDKFESDFNDYIIKLQTRLINKNPCFNNYSQSKYQRDKRKRYKK